MKKSDFQLLGALVANPRVQLTRDEVYRACVASANNGIRRKEEQHLLPPQRHLLDIRRLLKNNSMQQAVEQLQRVETLLNPQRKNDLSLLGDVAFLSAAIEHYRGTGEDAAQLYAKAAVEYIKGEDVYRYFRAMVNAKISDATLEAYTSGDFYAYQQLAEREGLHEITALIKRGRAHQFLLCGRFAEAAFEAENSLRDFALDGCPIERSIAVLIAAIAHLLANNELAARRLAEQAFVRDGKAGDYWFAYEALLKGVMPQLPAEHPLEGVPWQKLTYKKQSIPGLIIQRLSLGPATKDEIISSVWGENAIDPSYVNRFFAAMNYLRKQKKMNVQFDGQRYKLA